MNRKFNAKPSDRISREEVGVMLIFAICFLIIGGVAGWSARTIHSRNTALIATAETHAANTDSRQQQFNQFINAGSKGEKE